MAWFSSKMIRIWTPEFITRILHHWEIGQNMSSKYAITSNVRYNENMLYDVNSQASGSVRSLYYTSLAIHGPRLFNSIPATIRNMTDCSVDTFKRRLDKYLRMVPDEPHISGYTASRRAESNSLFDMAQFASAQLVSTLEEPDQVSVARGGHPWPPWD